MVPAMETDLDPKNIVGSIIKGSRLLDLYTTERRELSLSEFATETGFNKTTTYRLLQTLVAVGWLVRSSGGGYRLGTRLLVSAESLTKAAQRLILPRDALAPEYEASQISRDFRPNGSIDPAAADFSDRAARASSTPGRVSTGWANISRPAARISRTTSGGAPPSHSSIAVSINDSVKPFTP